MLPQLVNEAALSALRRVVDSSSSVPCGPSELHPPMAVLLEDFKLAETRVRPSAMREVAVDVAKVRLDGPGSLPLLQMGLHPMTFI